MAVVAVAVMMISGACFLLLPTLLSCLFFAHLPCENNLSCWVIGIYVCVRVCALHRGWVCVSESEWVCLWKGERERGTAVILANIGNILKKTRFFPSLPSDDRDFPRNFEEKRVFRLGKRGFSRNHEENQGRHEAGRSKLWFLLWEWFSNEPKMLIQLFV